MIIANTAHSVCTTKEEVMKRLVIALLLVALTAGFALAKDFEVKKKAGSYDVEVRMDKNPPVVGDNNITIDVKEAGKAVTDAVVVVDYSMPAMPGMPAMNSKTETELKGSVYKGTMNISMAGAWNVAVKIRKNGKTSTVKFNVDAH